MSVIGAVTVAVGVGLLQFASFGVDPFTSLMLGMDQLVPIDYGTLYVVVNAAMLLFSLATERKYIGIGTVMNLLFTGYIAAFVRGLLGKIFPDPSLGLNAGVFLCSFFALCLGSAVYMTADMGVSAYDAMAMVFAYKWKIGKFKYLRICTDIVCVAGGAALFLLGGGEMSGIPALVGVGTVITAFCMGPVIDFFNRCVSRWFLCGQRDR